MNSDPTLDAKRIAASNLTLAYYVAQLTSTLTTPEAERRPVPAAMEVNIKAKYKEFKNGLIYE